MTTTPNDEREALARILRDPEFPCAEAEYALADAILAADFSRRATADSDGWIACSERMPEDGRIVQQAAARLLWHLCPVNTPVSFHEDWRKLHSVVGGDSVVNALNADRPNDDSTSDHALVPRALLREAALHIGHGHRCISEFYEWDGTEPMVIPCDCFHEGLVARLREAAEVQG